MTRDQSTRLGLACLALTLVFAMISLSVPTAGTAALVMIGASLAGLSLLLSAARPTGPALRPALVRKNRRTDCWIARLTQS